MTPELKLQIAEIKLIAAELEAWCEQGCPVNDDADVYPFEVWGSITCTPDVLNLVSAIESLQAELEAAKADQARSMEAVYEAWYAVGGDLAGLRWNDFVDEYDAAMSTTKEKP